MIAPAELAWLLVFIDMQGGPRTAARKESQRDENRSGKHPRGTGERPGEKDGQEKTRLRATQTLAPFSASKKKGCNTRTSQGVTHPSTALAQARLTSEF